MDPMEEPEASGRAPAHRIQDLTPRQAALTAGFSMLIMTAAAPFAEFFVFQRLISPAMERSVQNIVSHKELFLLGIFAFLVNFVLDVVISWAFYFLLAPVNRPVSVLAALFRLVYTAVGLSGLLRLVAAFRLLDAPDYLTVLGSDQRNAHAQLLLSSFRSDWSVGLVFFGIHLSLLGYLVYRSVYIPRIIGVLLAVNGLAWVINNVKPYLYPTAHLEFISVAYFAELVFMAWLLIKGWAIKD
jgi:hypothetical protein